MQLTDSEHATELELRLASIFPLCQVYLVYSLLLTERIPPRIYEDDFGGHSQIQTETATAQGGKQDLSFGLFGESMESFLTSALAHVTVVLEDVISRCGS